MAIIWQRNHRGRRLEVRSAGRSRRLYVDGVLHSQYNPRTVLTGSVWDLLVLPALVRPPGAVRRVLILGLGGGAVVHLMRRLVAPTAMVAVDLEALVITVAKRFFRVVGKDLTIIHADAQFFVETYRGPRFDMVIDDVFGEHKGEPVRAIAMTSGWSRALCRLLAPGGTLVANFPHRSELERCGLVRLASLRRRFQSALALATPYCDNAVGSFFRTAEHRDELRHSVEDASGLRGMRGRLRFGVSTLW